MRTRWALVSLITGFLLAGPLRAEPPKLDVPQLAARIDQFVAQRWQAHGVTPAPLTDDAAFFRRVHLDLAGRIPSISRVRDFIDDPDPDKRRRWVDELLDSPEHGPLYAHHFANVWRDWLTSYVDPGLRPYLAAALERWLRDGLQKNVPYDRMVRELLTGGTTGPYNEVSNAFYTAHGRQPENLAASTSRLFLGVNLECAQCHNHPFARWTRQQFWEYAAFFVQGPQPGVPRPAEAPARDNRMEPILPRLIIPGTDRAVGARTPDGKLTLGATNDPRAHLAAWLTAPDNPYFARALANRLWVYFFGIGLVEPFDEWSEDNPPSHPELLDDLARQLAAHRCDVKFLIRAIIASRAYQLSSVGTVREPRLFARAAVRALTAEQLFDSVAEATGYRELSSSAQERFFNDQQPLTPRGEFLARFDTPAKRTEPQTTILQALFLMNGKFMTEATSPEHNSLLATIADARTSDTARRLDELYMVTLGRKPRPREKARLIAYLERGGASGDRRKALADVYWALLNSSEFFLNH